MEIKTDSGFVCDVAEDALDDMEILEALIDIDSGNPQQLPFALKRLLGEDNKTALYSHVRNESGRVPVSALSQELRQIFKALTPEAKK